MSTRSDILWPVLAHMTLVFGLYAWLSVERTIAVRRGDVTYAAYEFAGHEPPHIARIARNLSNQFELPVLFYAALLLLEQYNATMAWDVWLAWLFVAGRVLHTAVQTQSSNVELRGRVFTLNALACMALVVHLAVVAWQGTT